MKVKIRFIAIYNKVLLSCFFGRITNLKSVFGGRLRKSDFVRISYRKRQWGTVGNLGFQGGGGGWGGGLERAIRLKKSVKNSQKSAKSRKKIGKLRKKFNWKWSKPLQNLKFSCISFRFFSQNYHQFIFYTMDRRYHFPG